MFEIELLFSPTILKIFGKLVIGYFSLLDFHILGVKKSVNKEKLYLMKKKMYKIYMYDYQVTELF